MRYLALLAILLCPCAHAAVGLGVVTTDATCAGQPVDPTKCTWFLGAPKNTDVVRVSPSNTSWSTGFTWNLFSTLAPAQQYEGCLADATAGSTSCPQWGWVTKAAWSNPNEPVAIAVDKILAAAKSINARTSSTLLSTDRAAIKAALGVVGTTNVHTLIAPPPPVILAPVVAPPVVSPVTAGMQKWHPGDYYRANEQAFAYQRSARAAVWDKVKADPLVKGGLVVVPWGSVDKGNGVYDFSEIDADIAALKAGGKQLIIEVWWMNYWHDFATRARGQGWVPDYTIDNGCAVPAKWDSGSTAGVGYTIQLHKQECMDQLIGFFQALAKRYDADPTVEQIIITEPSTPYAAWQPDPYLTQFKRLVAAVGTAWTKTTSVFYMNWFAQPGEMMAATAAAKVGIGGPDLLPPPRDDDGGKALRGSFGGNYGSTDYRGRIPVSYSFETCCTVTAKQADDFAINTLKATHIAWVIQSGDAGFALADIQAVIRARGGKTVTAYPADLPK